MPSMCSGVVKTCEATGALSLQSSSGSSPASRTGTVKAKNCVMTSRPSQRLSTLADIPVFFLPASPLSASSLPTGCPPKILANAASLAKHVLMLATVEHRSTGVTGEIPDAFASVSAKLAARYVAAQTAQSHRKDAESRNATGALRMLASLLPIAGHSSFFPAALRAVASSMTATSGALTKPAHAAAARSLASATARPAVASGGRA
mmetsp:Transcript_91564/g.258885  ORF Transcript_91564/g.258885 Transcript_91564/m.258885 type:complete len:206 (-) Transcript_91564:35-652(-)